MVKDYYFLLGLPRGVPLSEVKAAYRKLAAQYHPDKVVDMGPEAREEATAKMAELNEAIATLSDPVKRAEYEEVLQLIPERKRKPPRPAKKPSTAKPPPAAKATEDTQVKPAPAPGPLRAPGRQASPAVSETHVAGSAMLVEEHMRSLRGALKKLPLKWTERALRGWRWALEAGDLRRTVLVAHRHVENLGLLSIRGLLASLEVLLRERRRSLRPATVIALVSYERLMDSQAVQKQLQELVAGARGWLKNVRPVVVLYDGVARRSALLGSAPEDAEIQRVVRLLLAGR